MLETSMVAENKRGGNSWLGLRRRTPSSTENRDEVKEEIRNQLLGSGENLGM